MKRSSRSPRNAKKHKPKGLKRISLADGTRVWVVNNQKYLYLRDVPNVR